MFMNFGHLRSKKGDKLEVFFQRYFQAVNGFETSVSQKGNHDDSS